MKWFALKNNALHPALLTTLLVTAAPILWSCRTSDAAPTEEKAKESNESAPVAATSANATAAIDSTTKLIVDAGADAIESASDAAPNVVASAAFDAGDDAAADAATTPACPSEMVHIGRYCVDKWEAHLATKNADGTLVTWPHFQRPEDNSFYLAQSSGHVFPQAYISRVEAKKACIAAGKRLCARSEWMRACKGSKGFRYPYGNKGKRGACNTGKAHLLHTFFGAKRGGWTYDNFNDPKLNQEPGFLAKTSDYDTCQSNEEVFDMVGNLHEWINDDVRSDIIEVLEKDGVERKEQPWRVGNAMFMGGFFSTTIEHGPGCTYTTIAHEPSYHDYSTGFRCCKDAVLPDNPAKTKSTKKKKR